MGRPRHIWAGRLSKSKPSSTEPDKYALIIELDSETPEPGRLVVVRIDKTVARALGLNLTHWSTH